MNKAPEDVAQELADIYEKTFGGKKRGRYKISRGNLCSLSLRKRLEDSTIEKITNAAYDIGYIIVNLGEYFAVIEEGVMLNYRPVPKSVLSEFVENNEQKRLSDENDYEY